MSKPKLIYRYRCTESELYSVCRTGWQAYLSHQDDFFTKKPFYTSGYATAALAEIDVAQQLPDFHARKDRAATLRLQMLASADESRMFWQLLKSHIKFAYEPEFHKVKIETAGGAYFNQASHNDWEQLVSLMEAGNSFITANAVKLMEGDNMPATFAADYLNTMNTFSSLYDEFKKWGSNSSERTTEKVNANNAIYDKFMAMCEDGRLYFRKDPSTKEQFVFDNILKLVSSSGGSGLTGTIIDAKTGGGLGDVILSMYEGTNILVPAKYSTHSEGNGAFDFGIMANGNYTLKMEHASYVTRTETVELKLGTRSSKTFMMNM